MARLCSLPCWRWLQSSSCLLWPIYTSRPSRLRQKSFRRILKPEGPPLGSPPAILIWLVWIGLGVMIIMLGIWASNRRTQNLRAGDPVEIEAERAMQALKKGQDFKNVIVQCYRQMSAALQKEQGIELEDTMTAREFEHLLEAKGLPRDPVHQLTQLFEAARYSLQQFTPADEQTSLRLLERDCAIQP